MKYVYALMVAGVLGGCVGDPMASNQQVFLPDGQQGFAVDCSGRHSTWANCYEEAGKICGPFGYKVVQKSNEKGSESMYNGADGIKNGFSHSTFKRTLLIACGAGRFAGTASPTVPPIEPMAPAK